MEIVKSVSVKVSQWVLKHRGQLGQCVPVAEYPEVPYRQFYQDYTVSFGFSNDFGLFFQVSYRVLSSCGSKKTVNLFPLTCCVSSFVLYPVKYTKYP